jgi:hypothetical protein
MAQGSLLRLLVSVAGFLTGRFVILRLTRQLEPKQAIITEISQS